MSGLDDTIKAVLKKMQLVQRHTPGTDGYRRQMRFEMSGFSIYHCCPLVFMTLNPADTKHCLCLIYSVDGKKSEKYDFPFTASDSARTEYLAGAPNIAEIIAHDPRAAVRAFHKIISLVFECVLGASLSEIRDLKKRAKHIGLLFRHADGVASNGSGGLFGDVRAYYGAIWRRYSRERASKCAVDENRVELVGLSLFLVAQNAFVGYSTPMEQLLVYGFHGRIEHETIQNQKNALNLNIENGRAH